ncbi:MAG: response regulator transcription factor [Lentilitoribacter sp.]
MSADRNKVLIVEDKVEIASRIKSAVEQSDELEVSGVAGDVDTGLKYLFERKPRIVLVDLGLPDGSGVEIINAVAQTDWKCDALVISIFGDEARVIEALQAGAKGYLLKSGSMQSIGEDVKSVIEGGSPISPQIARHLLEMVRQSSISPDNDKVVIELTGRETEILNAVAKGYKRREIGEKLSISTGTVGNHINNIYQKLNVGSNTEAIAQATRMGIL